jgi:hypothetical protein
MPLPFQFSASILPRQKSLKYAAAPQALNCIPDANSNGTPDLPF